MIGEHEAGKGSVSRVRDMVRYGKRHDAIKWRSRKKVRKVRDK